MEGNRPLELTPMGRCTNLQHSRFRARPAGIGACRSQPPPNPLDAVTHSSGSAVRTPNDQVLVILGDSGMGKSTLASAFACSGADVLSDDGVLLDFTPPRVRAVPGYPGLRLWPDSLGALFAIASAARRMRLNVPIRLMLTARLKPASECGPSLPTTFSP